MADNNEPQLREEHATDKYGTKFVDKADELQKKFQKTGDSDSKEPAGGYDDTPVHSQPAGYTLRITFHRAENLPISDFPSFSSDPYVLAIFKTDLPKRHKQDPDMFVRTPTIHRNTSPVWETQWVVAHVPASGFTLKCRLYDEDPADHDDRLGDITITSGHIDDSWKGIDHEAYDLKKKLASKRAYTFRGMASVFKRSMRSSARIYVSVTNLGRSPGDGGRAYTVAPLTVSRHHSPLIGRIAGTKDREGSKNGKKSTERYNFQAIQMQLTGPVPSKLYHRYVEFKPFVAGMFTDHSLRGRILNRALHHQHARVYNYDSSTVYGIFEKPCIEFTQQFLEFVHYDQGGRIFTYVISLDGLWRFTETGKEFGIDMLSKHTMHSDVSIYIAFSGEFFIRRLKHPHRPQKENGNSQSPSDGRFDIESPKVDSENRDHHHDDEHTHAGSPKDPAYYELIIDNDSGTYRPNADLLPLLREFLSRNLVGLKVATLDCKKDEEKMSKLKDEQREKKKQSGKQITYMQNSSDSSLSSSDEEKLEARAEGRDPEHSFQKRMGKFKGNKNQHETSNSQEAENDRLTKRKPLPDDYDSRDDSSRSSQYRGPSIDDQSEPKTPQGGYSDKDLPTLLKKPDDAKHSRDLSSSSTGAGNGTKGFGDPQTGENKPAGGLAYNTIVSTANAEEKAKEKQDEQAKQKQ